MTWNLYDVCCGSCAWPLHLIGSRKSLVPYMGTKWPIRKQLTIVAPEQSGRIVDVFAGKEYLFTATVNESGEIHLAKNSSIAQEMIRRYTNNEVIRLRPV